MVLNLAPALLLLTLDYKGYKWGNTAVQTSREHRRCSFFSISSGTLCDDLLMYLCLNMLSGILGFGVKLTIGQLSWMDRKYTSPILAMSSLSDSPVAFRAACAGNTLSISVGTREARYRTDGWIGTFMTSGAGCTGNGVTQRVKSRSASRHCNKSKPWWKVMTSEALFF